ncbi:phage tail protein [Gracilibacillus thailandensis]|uniref:Uncharacterized protein n=1 Tax=Gracilibacillus thailandensis TaxID=563735 RepID=A0A6N7QT26_9BACI|nr:phage tail protein [Gracilibacillus thailandensis]MRI65168.1 hypothetical protein [Gracilibacillus thailandensis]
MYVRDLEGNEYPIQVTYTVDSELNGNITLSCRILPTKVNKLFINDITEMWEIVDHDDEEYKIIYAKKQGEGNTLSVQIKAIPLFYDVLSVKRIEDEYNGSMTASAFFDLVFDDIDYNYVLVDSFNAQSWQGLGGGATKMEVFQDGLNRYGCEFRRSGNTIYLESQVGRDTSFMYRYKLNASNISQENDASAYYTYAKGYGDYAEEDGWQSANLIREYTSPLADILGPREAPPIKDGRITSQETMDERLETLVNESLKISVTTDIHDLREQGYPLAQPMNGDRVFLIDERIDFDEEVRIVRIQIQKDWQGKVRDLKVDLGTPGIVQRYQSNLRSATEQINAIMEGRTKIPFSVLDEAVAQATKSIKNAETELQFPDSGGILAVDKNDPNKMVALTSGGLGVSNDGGNTFPNAITGDGIVADYITAGTLSGITIISDSGNGDRVLIEDGRVHTYEDGVLGVLISNHQAHFYDSGTDDPNPNPGSLIGGLGVSWKQNNPGDRLFTVTSFSDGFTIDAGDPDTRVASPVLELDFNANVSRFFLDIDMEQWNITNVNSIDIKRMRFDIERAWEFVQYNSGSDTKLGLKSMVGSKTFTISDVDDYSIFEVNVGSGGSNGSARVYGDFEVTGAKNAVVPTDSYGDRLMYSEESTKSYFKTYIKETLPKGQHTIDIDPMFLETINGFYVLPFVRNGVEVRILQENTDNFVVEVMDDRDADVIFSVLGLRKGFENDYMEERPPKQGNKIA